MSKGLQFSLGRFFSKLNFSEKLLFSLLAAGAVVEGAAEEVYEQFGVRPTLRRFYFSDDSYFKKRKGFLGDVLSEFIGKRWVEFEAERRRRSFKLTRAGLDHIFSKFPKLRYINTPWDGYWRVVVYDIAENKKQLRSRLRKELKKLGFKFVQRSVWVSPLSLEKELEVFLRKEKLWGRVLVFKTQLAPEESRRLLSRHWRRKTAFKSDRSIVNIPGALFSDSFLPQGL